MKKITIPVLLQTDENYTRQMLVTIYSLLKNAKETTHYIVYILTPSQSYKSVKKMVDKYWEYLSNHEIKVISVDEKMIEGEIADKEVYTSVVYYRLFADLFITDFDKCIYLDLDVVVCGDLQEIYSLDLSGHYVCGVKDHKVINMDGEQSLENRLGIERENYINTGVLLINLKFLREKDIKKEFKEEMKKGHRWVDQDVINICCQNYILHMPLRYNMRNVYLEENYKVELIDKIEGHKYWENEMRNTKIIHYAGIYDKPWKQECVIAGDVWWNYAKEILGIEDIIALKKCIKEVVDLYDVANTCNGKQKVYLYGYTLTGIALAEALLEINVQNLAGFIDKKAASLRNENTILPINTLEDIKIDNNSLVINMGLTTRREITENLLSYGIMRENIIEYYSMHHKDDWYYETLPHAEYENEVNRLLENVYGSSKDIKALNYEERCRLLESNTSLKKIAHLDKWLLYQRSGD